MKVIVWVPESLEPRCTVRMAAFKKNLGPVASIDLDECSEEPLSPTSPALPESPEPSEPVMMRTESNSECPAQTSSASNALQKPAEHVPLDMIEVYSSPHPLSPTSAATDEQEEEEFERVTTNTSPIQPAEDPLFVKCGLTTKASGCVSASASTLADSAEMENKLVPVPRACATYVIPMPCMTCTRTSRAD